MEIVDCSKCGIRHAINPEKHKFRKKLCKVCKSPIANFSPKTRILSVFQKRKAERKKQTRDRFVQRMLALRYGMEYIAKRMVKIFKWEKE
jgi:hypothetical protein